MTETKAIFEGLKKFAESITQKMTPPFQGEPEDQLRAPFETFIKEAGQALEKSIVSKGETRLPGRLGKPDYGILVSGLLAGYVELKAPGIGAQPERFKSHNREQWKRFRRLPNLIYCDGNDWGLYRNGERIRPIVRLSGDVVTDGKTAVSEKDAESIIPLLIDFLSWKPIVPENVMDLAELLAPLCRILRDDVSEALKDAKSPLVQLAQDWRQLLFPNATDEQFADAYAQTVTFALLLGRSEGADPLTLDSAEKALAADHSLLSRALRVLTDPSAQAEISASLNLLLRVIAEVLPEVLTGPKDPWIYFYENFLAAYDPKLRKDAGAYYTPVEVVHAQVRLVDDLLINRLGKKLGFADKDVVTLDPAMGTGTYLIGAIDHSLERVKELQGLGAVPGQATALAKSIYGFEIMVGPYAVSELRISRALSDKGAKLPKEGPRVYLTDTLESPHTTPPQLPLILRPIAEQHKKALEVKEKVPVIVCLGNPPYDRHEAADDTNKARTGHWVRWGDEEGAIFDDFLKPAIDAGFGIHVKNLYNMYVYFWRWAVWKVFEHETAEGPGVVSYISASSYLDGNAFIGMREHMRRVCDEIWIIDLGGEGRGSRQNENVFAIQTPVTIAITARYGKSQKDKPAKVHYARIEGSRGEKLKSLNKIRSFGDMKWQKCSDGWQEPFSPERSGIYFKWPLLIDLMPWQHTGVEAKRTWPIAPDTETLNCRWRALMHESDRSKAFRGTGDREIDGVYQVALTPAASSTPIVKLSKNAPTPPIIRYAYRSFDRQFLIADNRLISRPRPPLWQAHGERQIYLTSLLTKPLGKGPAATSCAMIPDRDNFSARGAKDTIPFYRDKDAQYANITPGLLDRLKETLKMELTVEDFLAYIYGMIAQPAFTDLFKDELETRELRIPISKKASLFKKVVDIGRQLLWLHTYCERYIPKGHHRGHIPKGKAKCVKLVGDDSAVYPEQYKYDDATHALFVGNGKFRPVKSEVYKFEVSGLKVVQSWLNYRMKSGRGRRLSPLDDIRPNRWTNEFTTELLELLWVLEHTIELYSKQEKLLSVVIEGDVFTAEELPDVPDIARTAPSQREQGQLFSEQESEEN